MFNALSVVKFAASSVVAIGTGKIVGRIIKDHVTTESLIDKVTITAAAWVISGVVTTATKKYTTEMIDDVYTGINTVVVNAKKKSQLDRINSGTSTWEEEGLNQDDYRMDSNGMWILRDVTENKSPANN